MYTHLFTDMDGTLLDDNGKVTARTALAIHQAGVPLTLVSARSPMEMVDAITTLGLTGPQIAYNGGLIYRPNGADQDVLVSHPLPLATAETLVTKLRAQFPEATVTFYGQNHWYTDQYDEGVAYEHGLTHQKLTVKPYTHELFEAVGTVYKLMLMSFDPNTLAAMQQAIASWQLPGVVAHQSGDAYVEVTSTKAQKVHAINWLLAQSNQRIETAAAFGDGHNDIAMLQAVGHAVVMANADDAVKAVADEVTQSNLEDGVAQAIERWLQSGPERTV